jgi:cytochrome P450
VSGRQAARRLRIHPDALRRCPCGLGPRPEAIAANGYPEVATITSSDPPEHTRFRKLVYRAFTPEVVDALEPKIRRIADDLLTGFAGRTEIEFVTEFAELMPMYVMADALGVPRDDRARFKTWSDDIVSTIAGYMVLTPQQRRECKLSYVDFQHYFARVIEQRRADPGEDMISQLVLATIDDGRPLSLPELLDIVRIFLVAGNDTTSNLLAGALLGLLDNPAQLVEVQQDRTLIPNMVEEALRFVSPSRWTTRTVMGDGAEVAGCPIDAGERLRLGWGPANRDATRFDDPDSFDIHRDTTAHMAFGHGVHFCIGKDLARAEARIAFESLFDHFDSFELAVGRDEIRPLPVPAVNRTNHLPIRFTNR